MVTIQFRLNFSAISWFTGIAILVTLKVPHAIPLANSIPAISDSLFAHINTTHPRLILSPMTIGIIQSDAKSNSDISGALKFIRKQADSLMILPASKYNLLNGSLLDTSRQVLDRVMILAFMANIDHNRKYADRALTELDSASHFPNWGKQDFLDIAEMAAAFAIGYDWLHSFMTPIQRNTLARAIKEKAFNPAMEEFTTRAWWVNSKSNWNLVCNTGLALAAVALGNDESIAKSILHRTLLSIQQSGALQAFAPDGAYPEGIGYWCYSSQYLSMFFSSLLTSLNDDFGLSKLPGLAETGLFPIYCEGPSGRMLNYGDSPDARIYPFSMSGFGLYYDKPIYSWFAQTHTGLHPLEVIWYDPRGQLSGPESLPLAKKFRGPELAIFRNSWTDKNTAFLSLKAGNPKNEHSHLDVGNFIYEAHGKRWAVDLGSEKYSLPNYFIDYDDSSTRFTYYRVRAEGHNTLTINPSMAPDQELFPESFLLRFDPIKKIAIGDLTAAYKSQAIKVLRGIALSESGTSLIQDEFNLKAPGEVWWRMHTEATVSLSKDKQSAILTLGGKRVSVTLLSPSTGAYLEGLQAEPLYGTPQPIGQNKNLGITVLCVHLTSVKQGTIAIGLTPLEIGQEGPGSFPIIHSLDSPFWNPSQSIKLNSAPKRSDWKLLHGTHSFRYQKRPEGMQFTISEKGRFHLRILSLQGELLSEMQGQAPGEFTLKPKFQLSSSSWIDFKIQE